MTFYATDRMHAAASGRTPPRGLNGNLENPRTLVTVLQDLGLMVPSSLQVTAASGQSLRAASHKYTVKEVDAAIAKANLSMSDGMRLKSCMSRAGILPN